MGGKRPGGKRPGGKRHGGQKVGGQKTGGQKTGGQKTGGQKSCHHPGLMPPPLDRRHLPLRPMAPPPYTDGIPL